MGFSHYTPPLLIATLLLVGCGRESTDVAHTAEGPGAPVTTADTLLTNGKIYTLNSAQPWAEAVAIKDGKYSFVGSATDARNYVGENTRVIDLDGKMAMPGINDAHVHPAWGGLKQLFKCNFAFSATPEEIAVALKSCINQNPNLEWIVGGQWDSGFFDNHELPKSPRAWLDDISTRQAIVLKDDSGHNHWVNSKALELINIDRDTPDPDGGTIVHDQHGEPSGLLLENVRIHLDKFIPEYTADQNQRAAASAVATLNSLGITGFKDATAAIENIEGYKRVDEEGQLSAWAVPCYRIPRHTRTAPLDIEPIIVKLSKYNTAHMSTGCVKYYMDGVPTASRSAAMLSPYIPAPESEGAPTSGSLLRDPEIFTQELIALDRQGITVKIHAAGDRSIRVALDAIEAARKANGNSGPQHELAHAEYIDAVDVPRFAKLGVVADMSPAIWHPSSIMDSIVSAVGERGKRAFPFRSLLETGARVTAGSDWPSAVESPTPWRGMEAMVTRQDPTGELPGTLWADQAITLEQAIRIYTLSGAKALGLEGKTGSLEVGKSADLIILDRNLFKTPVETISDTQVMMTLFEGKTVYQQ